MIDSEVDTAINDSVVVHFDKIAVADFLISGNGACTVSAADAEEVCSSNPASIRVRNERMLGNTWLGGTIHLLRSRAPQRTRLSMQNEEAFVKVFEPFPPLQARTGVFGR